MSAPINFFDPNRKPADFAGAETSQRSGGCAGVLVWAGVFLWVCGVAAVSQGVSWTWQQLTFGAPPQRFDPRWIIALVGGLALWLPLLALEKAARGRYRSLVRPLRLASELVLLMVPGRLLRVTDSQALALWQVAACGLLLARLAWAARPKPAGPAEPGNPLGEALPEPGEQFAEPRFPAIAPALAVGGIVLLPWVAWGALGSPLDTLLGVGVAFLAGLAAARLILTDWSGPETGFVRMRPGRVGVWMRTGLVMVILAMALGANGNEWLLLLCYPAAGWLGLAFKSWTPAGGPAFSSLLAPAAAVGYALSGPLVWIDPDELSLLVTSGPGELMEWALRAGLVMLGCILISLLGLLMLRRVSAPSGMAGAGFRLGAALVWLALVGVYALAGRPGWYGERIFVILKEQPDVSAAKSISDVSARRQMVYQTLTRQAESSQAGLRQALDGLGIHYTPYYLVNALEVEAGPLARAWLLTRPEVDRVLDSPRLRPLPDALPQSRGTKNAPASPQWNLTMEQANLVWDELKVTGKGVVVGQSDSGVDGQHPELSAQYLGRNGRNDYAWLDPWFGSREPTDIGGHGTHTLGSILGKTVGVAPDAQWIGCVNLARNLGNPALYLNCMQFMLAPYPQNGDPFKDGRPERGAQVLNNSWGCPDVEGCDAGVFLPAVRSLAAAGIFVVVSAGNDGEYACSSLDNPPAIYAEVFTVGAVNAAGNRAAFSSLGPVTIDGSQRTKPDLAAPGEEVLSAFPGGTYELESGTSMAGPQVVGVVALMWSANPKLVGDIDRTRQILEESARPYSGTISSCGLANTAGHGIVNAYQAVQAAQKIK